MKDNDDDNDNKMKKLIKRTAALKHGMKTSYEEKKHYERNHE